MHEKKPIKSTCCPICTKECNTARTLWWHLKLCDKKHNDFLTRYKAMIIRLYNKGWTRKALTTSPHMFFSSATISNIILAYIKKYPKKRHSRVTSVKMKCATCGKPIRVKQHKLKLYKSFHCSKECQTKGQQGKCWSKPWITGLTKETDERLAKKAERARGFKHSEKSKQNMRIASAKLVKTKNWREKNRLVTESKRGIPRPIEVREKISKALMGRKRGPMSKKNIRKIMHGKMMKPNNNEKQMMKLIKQNNLPYRYNGNVAKVIIGNRVPDFIHASEKKVIEVFGEPFHDPKVAWFKIDKCRTYDATIEHYKEHGYDCIIIWTKEMKYFGWEDKVLEKIRPQVITFWHRPVDELEEEPLFHGL